ncbi:MAG: hypothetical protein AVDCRST_MAG02-2816, partial [uncultured Rubrobacteraceae bacterium]
EPGGKQAYRRPLHRGDEGPRLVRGTGPRARRPGGTRERHAPDVPPHHRGRGPGPVRGGRQARGRRGRLGGLRGPRRPTARGEGRLQPLRRGRTGPEADALPALLPGRGWPPPDAYGLQGRAGALRRARLARHLDPVRPGAAGSRGGGERTRRGGCGVRDLASEAGGFREAAPHLPRRGTVAGRPDRRHRALRRPLSRAALAGIRPPPGAGAPGARRV